MGHVEALDRGATAAILGGGMYGPTPQNCPAAGPPCQENTCNPPDPEEGVTPQCNSTQTFQKMTTWNDAGLGHFGDFTPTDTNCNFWEQCDLNDCKVGDRDFLYHCNTGAIGKPNYTNPVTNYTFSDYVSNEGG
jgi:hypothetical protein